jgi:hypothetical protein
MVLRKGDVIDTLIEYHLAGKAKRIAGFDRKHHRRQCLEYLLDEFAGTATYYSWYKVPEIYNGFYVADPVVFERGNSDPAVKLTLPETLPVHINRLEMPLAA